MFIHTNGEQVLVVDEQYNSMSDALESNIKAMHYNQDGSLIILSHTQGGIIPISNCDYKNLQIAEPDTYYRGFKMIDKVVLASRYNNIACYDDPTAKDCRLNLHMSHDGDAAEWWQLFRGVTRYDLIKNNNKVGALALGYEGMTKSQVLYYFADIEKNMKFKKLTMYVHEYWII